MSAFKHVLLQHDTIIILIFTPGKKQPTMFHMFFIIIIDLTRLAISGGLKCELLEKNEVFPLMLNISCGPRLNPDIFDVTL